MNNPLIAYFNYFTKDQLKMALEFFDQDFTHQMKKKELVEMMADLIYYRPVEWLYRLPERDMRILLALLEKGPDSSIEQDTSEYPSLLVILNLVYVDDIDSSCQKISIDSNILFQINGLCQQVFRVREMNGSFDVDRIILGLLNHYGVIRLEDFVHTILDVLKESGMDDKEIYAWMEKSKSSSIISINRVEYKGDMYLVSPFAFDYEHIIDSWKEYDTIKGLGPVDIERARKAGCGVPYCAFGTDTPEYAALRTCLSNIGYNQDELDPIIHEIWINSQYSMEELCAEAMFSSINDMIDCISDFREYEYCAKTVSDYANIVPKWMLRGHSSNDTNLLKVSIRVDESEFLGEQEVMEDRDSVESMLQSPLNQFFRYGMAVRHARADEPCPCGSGLKYKNCHGKILN